MKTSFDAETAHTALPHPRRIGWIGTTALAMGGSNQSLFLLAALFVGQGSIPGQGSAAVPLLIVGLVLSWMALPGWTELVLMWPNRVGGISASCAEAFRPYSPVLANLTGVCYWWGWVPTCGLTALLSASAIHHWYLPTVPITVMAIALVLIFTAVNLCGIHWATRLAVPIATASGALAFLSALIPVFSGHVDWHQATTFELFEPFPGVFGKITSAMAGLYLIGFAAPAFEQAACHVGETIDPNKNVPRAMFASAWMATLYFAVLPVVWLGVLGPKPLGGDLALELGPTFAPLFGSAAKGAAIWFMTFNMFHGTLAPLAGAARTMSQLAEDGLLPRVLAQRDRADAPLAATLLTAGMAIIFLLAGDPIWLVAAANLTYLIGICLPSVAVWLLRRDAPDMPRPYRAPRSTVTLGVIAACVWGISTILGFQQFGLPTVIAGLVLAYSGSVLYAWRKFSDRRRAGLSGIARTLHLKLTGAMLLVLALDGVGYLIAVHNIPRGHVVLIEVLSDIFVAVALLTISVGLVLPGMIAHSAVEVAQAAHRLASGTLADFCRAMLALSKGDLDAAHARVDIRPVPVHSRDELGDMAASFNTMQEQIARAAVGLDGAREGLRRTRQELEQANAQLEQRVTQRTAALSFLADASTQLAASLDYEATLTAVADLAVPQIADLYIVYVSDESGELRRVALKHHEPLRAAAATELLTKYPPSAGSPRGLESVFRTGAALFLPDITAESLRAFASSEDHFILLQKLGCKSYISVPLRGRTKILGALALGVTSDSRRFTEADLALAEDLARRASLAIENAELYHQAQAANHAKDKFLAVLSHELRTPLTPVLAVVTAFEGREDLPPNLREAIDIIRRNIELEARLIEDLLDLTRISKDKLRLNLDTADVHVLLRDAVEICQSEIFKKKITVNFALEAASYYVSADSPRLLQVFWNLLQNAVKFTPAAGSITLRTCAGSDGTLRIEFADTGIGIDPDALLRIFDPFEQADHAITRQFGGLGLGLALSKALIAAHDGKIFAHSDGHDRGSTFIVELTAVAPKTAPALQSRPAESRREKGAPLRVLLAEDHEDTRTILSRMLNKWGYEVETAANVRDALEKATLARFDFLVSDLGLPDASGLDLMRELSGKSSIRGVAISGYGMAEDIASSQLAGFAIHLTKPVAAQKLKAALEELAGSLTRRN